METRFLVNSNKDFRLFYSYTLTHKSNEYMLTFRKFRIFVVFIPKFDSKVSDYFFTIQLKNHNFSFHNATIFKGQMIHTFFSLKI